MRICLVPALFVPLLTVGCGRSPLYDETVDAASLADSGSVADSGALDAVATDADRDGMGDDASIDAESPDGGDRDAGVLDAVDSGNDDGSSVADAGGTDTTGPLPDAAPDAAPDAGPETVAFVVSGRVRYEDRLFTRDGFTGEIRQAPAAGFVVQLLSTGGSVVVEQNTDDDGRFEVAASAQPGTQLAVRVLARAQYLEQSTVVRDRTASAAIYSIRSDFTIDDVDGARYDFDMVATADLPVGGAFNIAAVIYDTWGTMPDLATDSQPEITYAWQPGLSWSCGSCYSRNRVQLGGQLEDPDEYDDDIIRHEFGHFWVEHFSDDDSPGGSHRDRLVEPTLAWGEGVAYFLAAVWGGNGWYVDNFEGDRRLVDHEEVTVDGGSSDNLRGTSGGDIDDLLREEVVSGMLWDAYDVASPAEPFDVLSLGRETSLRVIIQMAGRSWGNEGARGIDAADWLVELVCAESEEPDAVESIASGVAYPWASTGCGKGGRGSDRIPSFSAVVAPLAGSRVVVDRGDAIREFAVSGDGVAAPRSGR